MQFYFIFLRSTVCCLQTWLFSCGIFTWQRREQTQIKSQKSAEMHYLEVIISSLSNIIRKLSEYFSSRWTFFSQNNSLCWNYVVITWPIKDVETVLQTIVYASGTNRNKYVNGWLIEWLRITKFQAFSRNSRSTEHQFYLSLCKDWNRLNEIIVKYDNVNFPSFHHTRIIRLKNMSITN